MLAQDVLDEDELTCELRSRLAERRFDRLGGVPRSLGCNAHMVIVPRGVCLTHARHAVADLAPRVTNEARQHVRGLLSCLLGQPRAPGCVDEPLEECEIALVVECLLRVFHSGGELTADELLDPC